ncbi:MAG: hypothetical protein DLM52_05065, partial [Chthoniobacterales bacterium]
MFPLSRANFAWNRIAARLGWAALLLCSNSVLAQSPANAPPVVQVGASQFIHLSDTAVIPGYATDDGLPLPPGQLSFQWSVESEPMGINPAAVVFTNANAASTRVTFPVEGTYVLRLTAFDSPDASSSGQNEVSITVDPDPSPSPTPTPANQPPQVSVGANQTITLPAKA